MNRIIIVVIISIFTSCSNNENSDLNGMGLAENVIQVQELTYVKGDSLISKRVVEFNNSGQITCNTQYFPSGQLLTKVINHYNVWGRLSERDWVNEKDNIKLKQIFHYSNGNIDSIQMYDSKGRCDGICVYSFSNNSDLNEVLMYDSLRKLTFSEHYKYDDLGHIKELRMWSVDSLIDDCLYKYKTDSLGRVIEYLSFNNYGEELEHGINNYQYDRYGSWIEKMIRENDNEIRLVKRVIEYK